jgi:hypothetical protein
MIKHTFRAGNAVNDTRWLLAGVPGGRGIAFASTPERHGTPYQMPRRRRLLHQSELTEGAPLFVRLRPTTHSGVRARPNPHRAR